MNDEHAIRAVGAYGGEPIEYGNIYTTEFTSDDELLAWVDRLSSNESNHILLLSRLPHRRLLEHIDISKVEAYWITERVTDGALQPDFDVLQPLILNHLGHHKGIIILEGVEWLATKHGSNQTLAFVRFLRESVHRKHWTIVLPIRPLAFDSQWLARLHREAPKIEIAGYEDSDDIERFEEPFEAENSEPIGGSMETLDDGTPILVHLPRLPPNGFTNALLRKRILQWRRMGIDVSEVEPALTVQDSNEAYALYSTVEEKVRKAVELDAHLAAHFDQFSASELASARFRIRQLTGLDELSRKFFTN